MQSVEFYFDYASPYSYLALSQIDRLSIEGVSSIELIPVSVIDLQTKVGNSPTSFTCKNKRKYVDVDLARWADFYGIPLKHNRSFYKTDFRTLLRGAMFAHGSESLNDFNAAVFRALWVSHNELSNVDRILEYLNEKNFSVTQSDLLKPALETALQKNLCRAVEAGAFGTPTFILNGEIFFGNDRIDFLERRINDNNARRGDSK